MEKKTYIIERSEAVFSINLEFIRNCFAQIEEADEIVVASNDHSNWSALLLGAAMALDKPIYRVKEMPVVIGIDSAVEALSNEWEEADNQGKELD